jgi:adenosylcobinamide-GDP ribazoletransferase
MRAMINSFVIAFAMYSKIPMPRVDWNKDNMRYVMCFFPVIGVVIGGIVYWWSELAKICSVGIGFQAAIYILLPIVITGGIHMDGLLDTSDALSSYQTREKKLEIMKDSHAGAFAVIVCACYFLLSYGIWQEINTSAIPILAIGFVLSRALSGLSIVTFPIAKNSGLASMFAEEAKKKVTLVVMLLYIILCSSLMLWINFKLGAICIVTAGLVFVYYRYMSVKQFGGITGDVAGYFLQVVELAMAITVSLGAKV